MTHNIILTAIASLNKQLQPLLKVASPLESQHWTKTLINKQHKTLGLVTWKDHSIHHICPFDVVLRKRRPLIVDIFRR